MSDSEEEGFLRFASDDEADAGEGKQISDGFDAACANTHAAHAAHAARPGWLLPPVEELPPAALAPTPQGTRRWPISAVLERPRTRMPMLPPTLSSNFADRQAASLRTACALRALHEEAMSFCAFVSPAAQERAATQKVVTQLQHVVDGV